MMNINIFKTCLSIKSYAIIFPSYLYEMGLSQVLGNQTGFQDTKVKS